MDKPFDAWSATDDEILNRMNDPTLVGMALLGAHPGGALISAVADRINSRVVPPDEQRRWRRLLVTATQSSAASVAEVTRLIRQGKSAETAYWHLVREI